MFLKQVLTCTASSYLIPGSIQLSSQRITLNTIRRANMLFGGFHSVCNVDSVRQTLTMAIHRTICSSMKLLKYWLRKRRPGPTKAVSGRCNSLLVMCATYTDKRDGEREALTHMYVLTKHETRETTQNRRRPMNATVRVHNSMNSVSWHYDY